VLPPDDLTDEPGREAFLNGVHDALVVELGRLGLFDVVSRASMMRYRGSALPLDEIADAQDVDALLATSVLRDGDSLAVTAQLLKLHPERTVWADRYRRGVGDVFAIGSEIARSVAGEVAGESPISDGRSTLTADPEAVDAYNFGVFHLEQRSREGFEQAVRYFELAIEEDSTFAPAYAGLAQAYGSSTFFGIGRPATNMPRIAELAETALELDGSLAQAHTVLAAVDLYWNWDFRSAESRARRAIELNPSDAGAHRLLSEVLAVDGRYDEALAEVERGSELEPLLPFSAFRPIVVLLDMDQFDGAIERAREGLEFHPRFWQGHWLLCLALRGADHPTDAVPECEEAAKGSGRLPMALGALGQTYALAGRRAAAESIARELEQRAARQYVGGSWIAAVEAGLGNPDRAFAWLERAYEERDVQLIGIRNGLLFDALRGDPRMDRLFARMGLSRPRG
jgi:TolB-like protein/Flp pilus assembly protein TadD